MLCSVPSEDVTANQRVRQANGVSSPPSDIIAVRADRYPPHYVQAIQPLTPHP